ncbi:MAG: amidophosphoribosyltransferase, partial [Woeseiaceae bacterium]|nr:amidophosphoribosyltransferase [Woeseiaceae bacterium]
MCGLVGIVAKKEVNQDIYDALTLLQHRGQDAAGIITWNKEGLYTRKSNGLIRDVFNQDHMEQLKGNVGMGHVRYPTAGGAQSSEAQPFYVNSPYGICLAHNGNLTNYEELAKHLSTRDRRHLSTQSDSEVLLNVFAHELQARVNGKPSAKNIFDAVDALHERCSGGYAVVLMIVGFGLVAFRDPNGIRPLILGKRSNGKETEYMVASESVALDVTQFEIDRDVLPGETLFINNDGDLHQHNFIGQTSYSPCIFEFVYFARPDSVIDKLSVYKARLRMGEELAGQIVRKWPENDIEVVIPIPDTSRTAASQVAYHLGVKYREGFIKNRYVGRTFIMPGQEERDNSVRRKLNAIDLEFKGKNVLLVDDSIVRGTTSKQIIKLARDAGARKVYFASAAPPVRHPNVYGIDMPAADELIANRKTTQEIQKEIGADYLIYQDLEALKRAVSHDNSSITGFDDSCFSGNYITNDVSV